MLYYRQTVAVSATLNASCMSGSTRLRHSMHAYMPWHVLCQGLKVEAECTKEALQDSVRKWKYLRSVASTA